MEHGNHCSAHQRMVLKMKWEGMWYLAYLGWMLSKQQLQFLFCAFSIMCFIIKIISCVFTIFFRYRFLLILSSHFPPLIPLFPSLLMPSRFSYCLFPFHFHLFFLSTPDWCSPLAFFSPVFQGWKFAFSEDCWYIMLVSKKILIIKVSRNKRGEITGLTLSSISHNRVISIEWKLVMIWRPCYLCLLVHIPLKERFFSETPLNEGWTNHISLLDHRTIYKMIFWHTAAVNFSRYLYNSCSCFTLSILSGNHAISFNYIIFYFFSKVIMCKWKKENMNYIIFFT